MCRTENSGYALEISGPHADIDGRFISGEATAFQMEEMYEDGNRNSSETSVDIFHPKQDHIVKDLNRQRIFLIFLDIVY